MSNNVSVNSSALGVFVCRLLLFRKSVRIVVLFINKIEKKKKKEERQEAAVLQGVNEKRY